MKETDIPNQYKPLFDGFREVFLAENLLRELVRKLLSKHGINAETEWQRVRKKDEGPRLPSIGSDKKPDVIDQCTFAELIRILTKEAKRSPHKYGEREYLFAADLKGVNFQQFRNQLEVTRDIRNGIAHFSSINVDAVASVRVSNRWLGRFLNDLGPLSSRARALITMYDGVPENDLARRRSLACASMGIPASSVVDEVANHLSNPTPESVAIGELPATLAAILNLRQPILFTQNATQAFRTVLDVVRLHEMEHDSRPGEEGADLARLLPPLKHQSTHGRLVISDLDHPSLQQMARVSWNRNDLVVVNLSDLIMEDMRGGIDVVSSEIANRYLQQLKSGNASAVLVPHVTWANGSKLDIRTICQRLRSERPLVTIVVDGAQAVGHIPLDIERSDKENEDIDFYVGCGHKWLRGPETVGFVRVGRRYNHDTECTQCLSYLSSNELVTDISGLGLHYRGEQIGTHQRGLAKGFLHAIRLIPDINAHYERINHNAQVLRQIIQMCPQLSLIDPPDSMKTCIVSVTAKGQQGDFLETLRKTLKGALFETKLFQMPSYMSSMYKADKFLRLSPGPDLTDDDFKTFQDILTGEQP